MNWILMYEHDLEEIEFLRGWLFSHTFRIVFMRRMRLAAQIVTSPLRNIRNCLSGDITTPEMQSGRKSNPPNIGLAQRRTCLLCVTVVGHRSQFCHLGFISWRRTHCIYLPSALPAVFLRQQPSLFLTNNTGLMANCNQSSHHPLARMVERYIHTAI
jgi:hypothetical protein